MKRTWHSLAGERTTLYTPIGIRPLDELTGRAPIGRVEAELDRSDGAGGWSPTEIKAVTTPGGVFAYPHLERHALVTGKPARRYRVRLKAEFYVPMYRDRFDGIEFDAYPHNDSNPPPIFADLPQNALLAPAPNYPFQTSIPVLRGEVIDKAGAPVRDAVVSWALRERVLTDERGTFALPLRWALPGILIDIDAEDRRSVIHRTGQIHITPPQALRSSNPIIIS